MDINRFGRTSFITHTTGLIERIKKMDNEVSDELKIQAKVAWDNHTDYYTCVATGNTYPAKDDLQSWGFFWKPEQKAWESECTTEWEKFRFERFVADGDWPGVILEFTKHKKSKWEKAIEDKEDENT